jgi:hypothetical protein
VGKNSLFFWNSTQKFIIFKKSFKRGKVKTKNEFIHVLAEKFIILLQTDLLPAYQHILNSTRNRNAYRNPNEHFRIDRIHLRPGCCGIANDKCGVGCGACGSGFSDIGPNDFSIKKFCEKPTYNATDHQLYQLLQEYRLHPCSPYRVQDFTIKHLPIINLHVDCKRADLDRTVLCGRNEQQNLQV